MKQDIIPYNPELKDLAKKLRQNMTYAEIILWKALRNKTLMGFDFDRQRPIDNYIVDFYCKVLKLAIEIDGGSHDYEEIAIKDKIRETNLNSLGITILHFKESEVRKDIKRVLSTIEKWVMENQKW
jgi:very-short-patch-repair endonuclease